MTELKTLKDLGWEDGDVAKEEVRAEAVKWVKEFRRQNDEMAGLRGNWDINFIKYFFNLTEEDLEEEAK
jgi:hypothetical protein